MSNFSLTDEGVIQNWSYISDYVKYSPYTSNPIYNFPSKFIIDTNNLSSTGSGISLHLEKDVTFNLGIVDRQSKTLNSFSDITNNPFVQTINISILDFSGNMVAPYYISGSSKSSFTFIEQENINIFGSYNRNFGVQIEVVDQNLSSHTSIYYLYGNSLEIESISVKDSKGHWHNQDPLNFQNYQPYQINGSDNSATLLTNNSCYLNNYNFILDGDNLNINTQISFAQKDQENIFVDWGDGNTIERIPIENALSDYTRTNDPILSGYSNNINGLSYYLNINHLYDVNSTGVVNINFYYSGQSNTSFDLIESFNAFVPYQLSDQGYLQSGDPITGNINFDISFLNDPQYTNYDYFDIYAYNSKNSLKTPDNFLKRIQAISGYKEYSFYLDNDKILPNTDYWFSICPNSKLSSGYSWDIGPYSRVIQPQLKNIIYANELILSNGDFSMKKEFITGRIINFDSSIIDIVPKSNPHFSYEYLTQFSDSLNHYCSSKLLLVDNSAGLDVSRTGVSLAESHISDYYFITYDVFDDQDNIYVTAAFDYSQFDSDLPEEIYANFKIYKTSV